MPIWCHYKQKAKNVHTLTLYTGNEHIATFPFLIVDSCKFCFFKCTQCIQWLTNYPMKVPTMLSSRWYLQCKFHTKIKGCLSLGNPPFQKFQQNWEEYTVLQTPILGRIYPYMQMWLNLRATTKGQMACLDSASVCLEWRRSLLHMSSLL